MAASPDWDSADCAPRTFSRNRRGDREPRGARLGRGASQSLRGRRRSEISSAPREKNQDSAGQGLGVASGLAPLLRWNSAFVPAKWALIRHGYLLLSAVLESASGKTFSELLSELAGPAGMTSTVIDLVSGETMESMFAPQKTRNGIETGYGLGWFVETDARGRRYVWHGSRGVGGRAAARPIY